MVVPIPKGSQPIAGRSSAAKTTGLRASACSLYPEGIPAGCSRNALQSLRDRSGRVDRCPVVSRCSPPAIGGNPFGIERRDHSFRGSAREGIMVEQLGGTTIWQTHTPSVLLRNSQLTRSRADEKVTKPQALSNPGTRSVHRPLGDGQITDPG